MSIKDQVKQQLISEFAIADKDTGSAPVQIAILTERIKNLTLHMQNNKHDHHSRRGLLILVGRRKRLLKYLKRTDNPKYTEVIQKLGIRG